MSATLILVLVVIGAYVAAHVTFEWLGRRFLIVSGAEYLILGVLLGPVVSGLIHPGVMGGFAPFLTLALGWIGAVIGAQFHLPALVRIPTVYFRIAVVEAILSLVLVSAAMTGALVALLGVPVERALFPGLALGSIATASAPSGIALISRLARRREPVLRQLQVTTAVDAAVAVLAFGLLLSVAHTAPPASVREPTPTEWAVISVGIGVVGGALFHLFLGTERQIDRLFVALAGALILVSGAAAYLRLSPLLPAMLVGFILINTSANRAEIRDVLGRVERPLYFVLLMFAGAAWQPSGRAWILPVLLFLLARVAAKLAGGWVAAALSGALPALGHGWGVALLGQGGLAIAIALNYRLLDGALFGSAVFTAALLSVLLTDLSSARLAHSVVDRSGRRRRRGGAGGGGSAPTEGEA